MSTLLEQASLVMIPSGYAEDIVYSVIPQSGAGDLSFTRASNGTRINSDGNVEVVPWNLYTYSEVFSNSIWATGNATITSDTTIAPNGTTTADSIFEQAVNDYQIRGQNFSMVSGQQFTFSIYAKANTRNFFRILVGNGVLVSDKYAYFDLVNVTTTSTSLITSSIESVGNGWCKIVISFTCNNTGTDAIYFGSSPNMTSGYLPFVGNASNGVYIWGAQLNIGSTAKPYFPTTDRLNVPRLTYQNGGGGCPSLLLEKQSTNYARNNNNLNGWIQITSDAINLNNATSPDGTNNAINYVPNTSNASHMTYDSSTSQSSGGNFTMTCYAKANGYSKFAVRESQSIGYYASFNLSNGTVIDNGGNTASIESVGNGWYRCICSVSFSGTVCIGILVLSDSYTSGQPFGQTWSGDGTKGVLIYGPQLEVGSSYATSLISTAGVASATRVADACFKTGISSLIGQTEGVFYAEFTMPETQSPSFFSISAGSSANRIIFGYYLGALRYYTNSSTGSFSASGIIDASPVVGQVYRIAIGYKANDFVVYKNGTNTNTLTTFTVPASLTQMDNEGGGGTGQNIYASVKEILLFKTRLSNSELAQLTGNQNYTINQAYASYGVASESPNCVQP